MSERPASAILSVLLAVLGLAAGCARPAARAADPAPQVASLRAAGRCAAALAAADSALTRDVTGGAPAWRLRDDSLRVADLSRIVTLDAAQRQAWRSADSLTAVVEALADSSHLPDFLGSARALFAVRERLEGPQGPGAIRALELLGVAEFLNGERHEADADLRLSLRRWTLRLGRKNPKVAMNLREVAMVSRELARFDTADSCYGAAIEILRATVGEDSPEMATVLHSLANLRRSDWRHFRFDEAIALHRRALAIRRRLFGEGSLEVAESESELGFTLMRAGRGLEAEAPLRRAWETALRLHRVHDNDIGGSGWLLAEVLWLKGDDAGVLRMGERLKVRESLTRYFWPSGFGLARVIGLPSYEVAALLGSNRGDEAFEILELGRGAITDMMLAGGSDAGPDSLGAALIGARREERALRRRASRAPGRAVDSLLEADAARERALEARLAARERRRFVARGGVRTVPRLADVRATLGPQEAIVGWFEASSGLGPGGDQQRDACWAYVLRDHGPVHWVKLWDTRGRAAIERDKQPEARFAHTLARSADWPVRLGPDSTLSRLAGAVWRRWLTPIEPSLEGVTHLIVAGNPDLPFECLRDGRGRYMTDRFALTYTPSAWLYAALGARGEGHAPGGTCVAIAGPTEDDAKALDPAALVAEAAAPQAEPVGVSSTLLLRSLAGDPEALAQLPPLRHAWSEARTVAACFPRGRALTGNGLTPDSLAALRRELGGYRVVHFATHALVDADDPGRSALVVTAGRPGARDDGLVTAEDILRSWHLDADLVTLSGCRTASGQPTLSDEYLGFTQALLAAGARTVLESRWSVDDDATSLLMGRFYADLTGRAGDGSGAPMPPAEALREAQRWLRSLRDPGGRAPFAHPVYWAGFRLVGAAR